MKTIHNKINEIKAKGYQLDFGTVFEYAFENYKKIVLYAGSMLLLFSFVSIVVITMVLTSVFGAEKLTEIVKPENLKPENFTADFLLIYNTALILFSSLISPFLAGFLKMADCAEKDQEFRTASIFGYYKSPYFGTIFIASLIINLLSLGFSALIGFTGSQNLSIFASLTITYFSFLTMPLIVFGKLNAAEAIRSSIIIISKQPLLLLRLLTITLIGACIGFFAFCIGFFFTMPLIYSMQYSIYNSIIGMETENETGS